MAAAGEKEKGGKGVVARMRVGVVWLCVGEGSCGHVGGCRPLLPGVRPLPALLTQQCCGPFQLHTAEHPAAAVRML